MNKFFFIICMIGLIIQIFSISKLKENHKSKNWNIFIGINIAYYISIFTVFLIVIRTDDSTLNDVFGTLFLATVAIIINIILSIIGVVAKKRLKDENIKLNKSSFYIMTMFILSSIIFVTIIPELNEKISNHLLEKNTINYLNKKYGNNEFKVINIEKDYSYNGIMSQYQTGYSLEISTTMLKDNFIFHTYENDPTIIKDISEKFVEEYYNDYLSNKRHLEIYIRLDENQIPNNCGHVPTINELIDYGAINNITVYIKGINDYDIDKRITYLKDSFLDLINYLNISKDIVIEFRWVTNEKTYRYDIEKSDDTLKIIGYNEKYEFNLAEIENNK